MATTDSTPRHLAGLAADVDDARKMLADDPMRAAAMVERVARDADELAKRIRTAETQRRATEQP